MQNTAISLVNLDFDLLKNQLKEYLKSQSQFTDYDFDGSNMSVLLDILTYNTHLNAFYLNMVASEAFLDSAQLRSSVVSHVKALNYVPRSSKSSKSVLNLVFAQNGLSSFTIPKNTRFTGRNSRGSYQFLTNQTSIAFPAAGVFTFNEVEVFEGILSTDTFIVDSTIEFQRFVLSNPTIDTDSIEVLVSEDNNVTSDTYLRATGLLGVTSESKVYFIQAAENNRYELVFGDGVFGYRPKNGAIVTVTYRTTSASDGNDCSNFILNDNLGALNGFGGSIAPQITVVSASFGGAVGESIEEIKYRAPRAFQTQDRAITVADFTTLVTQNFRTIRNCHVYGGEQVQSAPRYGTVYVVPVTFTGELLSSTEKLDIQEFLKVRTSLGVTPVVIDPDFLFVVPNATVKFNSGATTKTALEIESICKDTIIQFGLDKLQDFNTDFILSELESTLSDADPSITSSQIELNMRKVVDLDVNTRSSPMFEFRNPIVPGTIISSQFQSGGRIYQYVDANPNVNTIQVRYDGTKTTIVNMVDTLYLADITNVSAVQYTKAGTIDYATGTITINPITINDLLTTAGLSITCKPSASDLKSRLNDIIFIEPSDVTVTVQKQ
jgi:hypothetical protein